MPKKVPFIPKNSCTHKPMRYYYCETDMSSTPVSRSTFLTLLGEQPCPMGQIYVDRDEGCAYLFQYCPTRAERFIELNRKQQREYERIHRNKNMPNIVVITFDHTAEEFKNDPALVDYSTPEEQYLASERTEGHRESFSSLPASDREILAAYLEAGCNARELARRLGRDPSSLVKLLKRAAERLQKNIVKNS